MRNNTLLKATIALCAAAALAVALLASSAFASGGTGDPALNLTVNQPTSALYGTTVPVTITAANPAGQDYGYNLSFSDVLPVGVTYQSGSSTSSGLGISDPTIVTNPSTGAQTLIWSNLVDLSGGSSYPVSFKLNVNTTDYDVGGSAPHTSGSFTTTAQAFVNTNPRYVPQFNSDGTPNGPSATSFTGASAAVPSTTAISAITIQKSGPAALLRGVHDHQGTYDLKVTNNSVNPTDTVTVDDWLPADLEFLGCGGSGADNTTNAIGTNAGSPDEYPGSGSIVVPAVSNCIQPTSVTTVDTTPPGTDANGNPLPAGVYTHVVWTVGNLTPGQVVTLPYTAAVPIRENTLNWAAGTSASAGTTTAAPATACTASNCPQAVDLDNNNGPETYNNEPIVNASQAQGNYQDPADSNASIPTSSSSVLNNVAKDIIIAKSVSSPTLQQNAIPTYTLTVSTSEYRFFHGVTVTDTLPNGQCPIGGQNYQNQQSSACAPVAGQTPSSDYTSVSENDVAGGGSGDGTYDLAWNSTTDPALAQIPVNGTVTITFPARTLRYYQLDGADNLNTPILSGDSITNNAGVSGTDTVRCTGGSDAEDCTSGTSISHDAVTSNGTTPETVGVDSASASQSAPEPSIEKEVAAAMPASGKCADASYQTTLATYGPGDEVCWLLEVNYPAGTDTRVSSLNDFLPNGVDAIANTDQAASADTLPYDVTYNNATTPQVVFTPCPASGPVGDGSPAIPSANCGSSNGDVGPGGQTFAVTFASTEGPPTGHLSGDVQGNLMKFASVNTAGVTDPLRSAADFQFSVPTLGLSKTIAEVNSTTEPSGTTNATVTGGDIVTYQLAVNNTGTADAQSAVIWDNLPKGESCSDVVASANYTCDTGASPNPDYIVFNPVFVAAAGTTDLTFQVNVPTGADEPSPGQALTDTAGVTSYQSTSNTGTQQYYYPANNLNPSLAPLANAPQANSSATVTLAGASITKLAASTVHEVNTSDATIGEPIAYAVTSKLPAGTTLYGSPTVTDVVPSTLSLNASSVTATLDGNALPYDGVTLTVSGNTITVNLGTTYAVNPGGDTVAINFDASVVDSAANKRTNTITNTATLAWNDSTGAPQSKGAAAHTTVVEPNLHIAKTDNTTGHLVSPGQTVIFNVTASNPSATDVSPAHDVAVVDTVPAGLTVLNTSSNPAVTGDTVSAAGNGGVYNATTRTITWSDIGTLAPGASTALPYSATVDADPASGTPLKNTATDTASSLPTGTTGARTSTSSTNTGYTATTTDTVTVKGPTITKTATPTSQTIGGQVQYQATVTLPADTVFHDLTVLDTLPNGLTFDSYGATTCSSGCTVSSLGTTAGTVSGTTNLGWFVGELGPFNTPQTITVDYAAHVTNISANADGDSLVNSATVQTDQTQKITTPPTSPPAASTFQNQYGPATAPVKVIEPDLGINKLVVDGSGTPSHTTTADPEDTLTYSVTVTNSGDSPAYNVNVSDTPPASLTDVTPVNGASYITKSWTSGSPTIKWVYPGPIAAGGSVTFTYTAVVPDGVTDQETIDNTASVPSYTSLTGPNTNGRTYTNNPQSSDTVTVNAPVLAITKTPATPTAFAGSGDSYTVTVSNIGHSGARNVTATDTVPAGMNYAAGSATASSDASFSETSDVSGAGGTRVVTWALGAIPAGGSVSITVPVTFPANTPDPTTLTNSVQTQAPNAPNSPTANSPITVHASADLQAIKSVATTPIPAGGEDTYTLTVKNNGPSDAQSVTLTDPLPSSETFVSADAGCTNNANTVTCAAGTVAAGASKSYHVTVSVNAAATGPISNTLTVASPTPDPNPSNNKATIAPDSISQAGLTVTKTADKIQYNGGDTITYTITASNAGPAAATGVVITDPLPNVMTFLSASAGCTEASATVTCDASGPIPAGSSESWTVKAVANGTPPPAATPGTGDELIDVSKVEQQVTLTAGETTTQQLTCGTGYISDANAKVIEVDQGTGTLESVEILKSWAINNDTYEFTLDNTATGNAQVQLFAVCLPSTTTADQNGNTHPLITGAQVTNTQTLTQGDHTITVDVGNADVPIAPSFQFLTGEGTVQGSEGSSNSSVWTYTIDVTTPTATVKVGSTPLQVQPGAAGGFTNDLEFTSVSQQVTVGPGQTTTESVICPNGYEGIEATYNLPDGLVLLGDDPEPITRVFLLNNPTSAAITGTVDLLCLADRTGPEVDYLGPVLNTAKGTEINVNPDPAGASGTAAIRIDRAVGSGNVIDGMAIGAPAVKLATVKITATKASVQLTCAQQGACEGSAALTRPGVRHHRRITVTVATAHYKLASGKKLVLVLKFKHGEHLTKAERKHLTLVLKPNVGKVKRVTFKP